MKEISEELGLHRSTLDRYLKILKDLGLVKTKPGRGGGVYPTTEGLTLLKAGHVELVPTSGVEAIVHVEAEDRPGLLAEVSRRLAAAGANIVKTDLVVENGIAKMRFEAEHVVPEKVIRELDEIEGLTSLTIETKGDSDGEG
ncbi:MAG: ACT domain-containing protein [Methanopyri archaeon]|nr:ACT domain-containing protein [Methanopyri archaeon]